LQRQVGLGVETADFVGRLVVIDDFEIGLLKIGDAFAALVGHDEDHVHFVGSGRMVGSVPSTGALGRRVAVFDWLAYCLPGAEVG